MLISYRRKAADGLLRLEAMLNRLQQALIEEGQANSPSTQLTAEITNTKKTVRQVFYLLQPNLMSVQKLEAQLSLPKRRMSLLPCPSDRIVTRKP